MLHSRGKDYRTGSVEVDSSKDKNEVVGNILKLLEGDVKEPKPLRIKDIFFEIEYNGKKAKLPIADTPRNRKMYGIPLKKTEKAKKKSK
jgi:hypothetical protein